MIMRHIRVVPALVLLMGLPGFASAQTNDEIFPQFQWNFATPGARANAMGRTFIGQADDATASVTNPAGLINLTRPQVYLEFKNTDISVARLAAKDSLFTLATTESSTSVQSLSFLSASVPVGKKLAVGFTFHQFLNYKESFSLEPRLIPNSPVNGVFFPVQGNAEFKGTTLGGSVAYAVTKQFSVGGTVSTNHLEASSQASRSGFNTLTGFPTNRTAVQANSILINQSSIDSTDDAISFTFGALARPSEKFAVGVQYAKGPEFLISETLRAANTAGTAFLTTDLSGFPKDVTIHVPDRFGVGFSARPTSRLMIGADIVRIKYSSLAENFTVIFSSNVLNGSEFTIEDGTEVHFGGEYNILGGKNPVFLRAGVFTNPDHAVTFGSVADADVNSSQTAKYNLLPRETDITGTVGAGVTMGLRAQFDVAYVFSKEFVASIALRF